ncbi:MAG: Uma2 family endonuclease [Cyanobacteria bacterium P01_A01_bin.40]
MMVTAFKWSIADWHELVNAGVLAEHRVELLEGEIIEMSPEGPMHSSTNYAVVQYFRELMADRAIIREAHPITLDNSEPEPDIAVVRPPYTDYFTRHPYPQDIYWLVEISHNTLKLDLERKSITYARNGIAEYWVIDLVHHSLIVHTQPDNNSYTQIQAVTSGTVFPQTFPQIAFAVDRILLF